MRYLLGIFLAAIVVAGIFYVFKFVGKAGDYMEEEISSVETTAPDDDEALDERFEHVILTMDNRYHKRGCSEITGTTMNVRRLDAEDEGAKPCPVCFGDE